jgi:hypothetical protein
VLYPYSPGKHFDFDYCVNRHVPLTRRLGEGYGFNEAQVSNVRSGINGAAQQHMCPPTSVFHAKESVDRFLAANGAEILAGIPNYADLRPKSDVPEALL